MAIFWDAGAVFGLSWFIFYLPVAIFGTCWFWQRRNVQPIKARSPLLVIITDAILTAYASLLCFQRIFAIDYPCALNLWSGYVGTITLFNTYVWRCWTLFYTFRLTQERIENKKIELEASLEESAPKKQTSNFFISHRDWISGPILVKVFGTLTVILLLPCAFLTATRPEILTARGDGCNKGWGPQLLSAYALCYAAAFLAFAWTLRTVHDGFQIREELKITGLVGLSVIFPWFLFNSVKQLSDFNNTVFPVSTCFLLAAITLAFLTSTVWPLYRSIFQRPTVEMDIPENLNTLKGLLQHPEGAASFQEFLTKEFSVENLLFFLDIEKFRNKKRELGEDNMLMLGEAQRIYAKYIIIDAPFQVNLPADIVAQLQQDLKTEYTLGKKRAVTTTVRDPAVEELSGDCPTIFDGAARNIFNLMDTDSCPRYFRSDLYRQLIKNQASHLIELQAMKSEGIV